MMPEGLYLDNDVVIKACAYGMGIELVSLTTIDDTAPSILALARYTITTRIKRSKTLTNAAYVAMQVQMVLEQVRSIEPTIEEVNLAAEFELAATQANLAFDTGESQLVAMMLVRGARAFVSGDKRAARAMSVVAPGLEGRLICMEQILYAMVTIFGMEPLRSAVCREMASDRAATICFQCSAQDMDAETILTALESYINALRKETGRLITNGFRLSGAEIP